MLSPAPRLRPASCTGPTGPTLRANPYPEVTDLICRLPLPTLIYRPEASYLGDQLRIWVRTGLKLGASRLWGPLHPCRRFPHMRFSRTGRGTRDAARTAALYGNRFTSSLSLCEWLPGTRRLKQKRKLFPGPPPMDAGLFPLPGSCYPKASQGMFQTRLRNKYRIPFRHKLPTGNFGFIAFNTTIQRKELDNKSLKRTLKCPEM